jgi:hypothetical protein
MYSASISHLFQQTLNTLWLALLISGGSLALSSCESRPVPWLVTQPAATETQQPSASDTIAAGPTDTATAEESSAPAIEPEPPAPPIKLRVEPGKPPYRMLPGRSTQYRRYVGRLGTRPVVVELFVGREYETQSQPQLSGRYYDARSGRTVRFAPQEYHPRLPLCLETNDDSGSAAYWRVQQPVGPRLTGTVTTAGQPLHRFTLREDYRQAVPLAIRSATMYGRPTVAEFGDRGEPGQFTGSYCRQYVQVMGKAAQRLALQRAFPSRPAQVQSRLRREFAHGEASMADIEEGIVLTLNDYDILGYGVYISNFGAGSSHPQFVYQGRSYDLRTGQRLTLAGLLRAGREAALRRLALQYMDPEYRKELQEHHNNQQAPAKYLEYVELGESFALTPSGLLIVDELGSHITGPAYITIPYAALRPLLRPRTPLNRILVARGLPPVL